MSIQILRLDNIEKKETPLSYRNEYTASVSFLDPELKEDVKNILFILERDPLGNRDIQIRLLDNLDYPALSFLKSLRRFILDYDEKMKLP